MSDERPAWGWKDAWVLCSITPDRDGDLIDIIHRADWINHSLLDWEEMDSGLGRLKAAGLATGTDRFRLTREGSDVVGAGLGGRGGSVHNQVRTVEGLLSERRAPEANSKAGIDREQFDAAVSAYHARMASLRRDRE